MPTDGEISALMSLIKRLEQTVPLSEVEIFNKRRARTPSFIQHSREEVAAIVERSKRTAPVAPILSPHPGGNPQFDLGLHVRIVDAQIDDWIAWAHEPPPHSANRILAITKRAKRLDVRQRFEDQTKRHYAPLQKPRIDRPSSGDTMVDYLHSKLPRIGIAIKDITHQGETSYYFNFEFCCLDCGGFMINTPDDGDEYGPVICSACKQVFGSFWDLKQLGQAIGNIELKRRGLQDGSPR